MVRFQYRDGRYVEYQQEIHGWPRFLLRNVEARNAQEDYSSDGGATLCKALGRAVYADTACATYCPPT